MKVKNQLPTEEKASNKIQDNVKKTNGSIPWKLVDKIPREEMSNSEDKVKVPEKGTI